MNTSSAAVESESAAQASLDYRRIEKAIAYLQARYLEQPDLAAIARAAHLSEFHFQRLFTRWAGISPKRFLQFLTIEHAKQQLVNSKAVLETTLDSGLSSPGRLHDLFVSVEAVTPGEFKTRGAGIRIKYGLHATHFGDCLLGVTERGVCWLGFVCGSSSAEAISEMKQHWAGATFARRPDLTKTMADRIFSGLKDARKSSLSLLLLGTNFQIKVWQALLNIPAGALVSYEIIGGLIDARNSSRAIGSAVGSNPIAYLIPCHRVIRKTGLLGGYRWGATRKRAILGWEAAQIEV
jgi:AraC family transcriptional regulator, regulatory protein of adaptative response / methylated-DNA-[protein]-cysteine methyltransferase